ncbi:MAG: hypothetical protein GXZ14_08530 [Ruminococcaceae bacterium]|nr:hypothetical protein [Oscillospiraceae bacterium]
MTTKSLRKQLMAAIAMVLVAAVALGSSTYAWFAANRIVTATDMKVTATTSGSLAITKGALPIASTTAITVSAEDASATALIPTTHDLTTATATGLVYNINAGNVSAQTGLLETGKSALTFAEATNSGTTYYYVDYVVYIAASGAELTGQDIKAKFLNSAATTLPGATSIDFYVASATSVVAPTVNDVNYGGTLNLAGLDSQVNDASTTLTEVTIKSNTTVPKAGTNAAIAVLMRVYVDGALKDAADTTYIKNIDVSEIADQSLGVQFEAVDYVTGP